MAAPAFRYLSPLGTGTGTGTGTVDFDGWVINVTFLLVVVDE